MKIVYFDCAAGISGEMIVGALLDLGCDINYLARELNNINFGAQYEITAYKTQKCGISATGFEINTENVPNVTVSADEIVKNIWNSNVNLRVKQITTSAILRIIKAQSEVFDVPYEQITFSLIKALNFSVLILASSILTESLGADRIIFSPISEGSGFVNISGNIFSIPEPIVSEILKEARVPLNFTNISRELITKDGAAFCCEIAESFSPLPPIIIKSVGYGGASFDLDDRPAVLRVILGETKEKLSLDINTEFDMETSGLFFENFGYNMNTNSQKIKDGLK